MTKEIFISEYLGKTNAGKEIVQSLQKFVREHARYKLRKIPYNKNEWCRDYMPVKNAKGDLIQFTYNPSYLREYKTYRETIPENQKKINQALDLDIKENNFSNIILDGGAVEIHGEKAILSDRVLSENSTSWKGTSPVLLKDIQYLLKVKELIVVPADPWDFTGHVDGMVRFVDTDTVLVNDLSGLDQKMEKENEKIRKVYKKWKTNFSSSLKTAGLKTELLPCTVHNNEKDAWATGVYMNFLKLDDFIIMPVFRDKENDNKAKVRLGEVYDREVFTIEATELSKKGGIINCVTWTIE